MQKTKPKKSSTTSKKPNPASKKPKTLAKKPLLPKLPNSVVVFGKRVKIVKKMNLNDGNGQPLHGMFHPSDRCIYIWMGGNPAEHWETLFHEMTHAAFHFSGLGHLVDGMEVEVEEAIVRMFEHFAFPLIDIKKLGR